MTGQARPCSSGEECWRRVSSAQKQKPKHKQRNWSLLCLSKFNLMKNYEIANFGSKPAKQKTRIRKWGICSISKAFPSQPRNLRGNSRSKRRRTILSSQLLHKIVVWRKLLNAMLQVRSSGKKKSRDVSPGGSWRKRILITLPLILRRRVILD